VDCVVGSLHFRTPARRARTAKPPGASKSLGSRLDRRELLVALAGGRRFTGSFRRLVLSAEHVVLAAVRRRQWADDLAGRQARGSTWFSKLRGRSKMARNRGCACSEAWAGHTVAGRIGATLQPLAARGPGQAGNFRTFGGSHPREIRPPCAAPPNAPRRPFFRHAHAGRGLFAPLAARGSVQVALYP
jgi:hypothetical protein